MVKMIHYLVCYCQFRAPDGSCVLTISNDQTARIFDMYPYNLHLIYFICISLTRS
jgi:hypothetical protein